MTHQEMLEIGAISLGILALFLVLKRGGSTNAAPVSGDVTFPNPYGAPPEYLGYNVPQTASGNSLGAIPASGNSSSTTPCACGNAPVQYANDQAFANYLTNLDETIVSTYQSSILASIPNWLGQYINNTFAPEEQAASQGFFSQFAG